MKTLNDLRIEELERDNSTLLLLAGKQGDEIEKLRARLDAASSLPTYTVHAFLDDPGGLSTFETLHEPGRCEWVKRSELDKALKGGSDD